MYEKNTKSIICIHTHTDTHNPKLGLQQCLLFFLQKTL